MINKSIINPIKLYKMRYILCMSIMISISLTTSSKETCNAQKAEKVRAYKSDDVGRITSVAKEINTTSTELTNREKVSKILTMYNLTQEQFDIIVAIVMGEAATNSYEDAYAVINTFYNRTLSKTWVNEVNKVTGVDNGNNIYAQITLANQSTVYTSGLYEEYLGITDGPVYQAVIDFLYEQKIMHDYLSFHANVGEIEGSEQFVSDGNLYYSKLMADDRVDDTLTLVRK